MDENSCILIIEDEPLVADALRGILDEALQRFGEDRPSAILKKPFSAEELKRAVVSALGAAA